MFNLTLGGHARAIALLAAAAWFGCPSQSEAAFGIIIVETVLMPVEDPLTQYEFKLALAGNNQILQGDNITFHDISNYDGNSHYEFLSSGVDFSQFFSIQTSQGSAAGLTNLALVLTSSLVTFTNATASPVSIGTLIVETNVQYPPMSGSPLFDPITYTTQTHLFPSGTLNTAQGITAASIVPEPCSVALLGIGLVIIPTFRMARGRRRLNRCG